MTGWKVVDVNLAGLSLKKSSLRGAVFTECNFDGATIDGIAVSDLLDCWNKNRAAA